MCYPRYPDNATVIKMMIQIIDDLVSCTSCHTFVFLQENYSLDLIHRKDGQLDGFLSSPNIAWVLEDIFYSPPLRRLSFILFSRRKSARVVFVFASSEEDREAKGKKTCKQYTGCARENTTTRSILGSNPHLTLVLDENISKF